MLTRTWTGYSQQAAVNLIIRHNNIDLNVATASSSISNYGGINNHIDDNRLNGGSYIIYFEGPATGNTVTNNFFGQYAFGYYAGAAANAQTYSGNIFDGTAAAGTTGTTGTSTTSAPSAALAVTIDTHGAGGADHCLVLDRQRHGGRPHHQ